MRGWCLISGPGGSPHLLDPEACALSYNTVTSLIISDRGSLARLNQDHLGEFLKMWLPRAHPRTKSIRNHGDQVWASMFVSVLFK